MNKIFLVISLALFISAVMCREKKKKWDKLDASKIADDLKDQIMSYQEVMTNRQKKDVEFSDILELKRTEAKAKGKYKYIVQVSAKIDNKVSEHIMLLFF